MAEQIKVEPVDPFKPLSELAPEQIADEGKTWHELMDALEVPRTCEVHSPEDECPIAGCKRLLAFRAYIRAHKKCENWRRWRARAVKAEMRAYLKKLDREAQWRQGPTRKVASDIAPLRKEADRDYALLGLYNRYADYLNGIGPKPEVS